MLGNVHTICEVLGEGQINMLNDPTLVSEAHEIQKVSLSFMGALLFAQAPTQNPRAISFPIG